MNKSKKNQEEITFLKKKSAVNEINNPITIVMQWLTYAFWGWTAISILIITAMVFSYFMQGNDVSEILPYSIAAVLVLLPISIICDFFYQKREPEKKSGAASVVMIIHGVIFALCCVGALVTIVLNLVKTLIGTSSVEITNSQVYIYCALIMVAVYAVLFLRTIVPAKLFKLRLFVTIFMIVVSASMVIAGFVGPIANTILTKNDKFIEDNLAYVVDGVTQYVDINQQLPNKLTDITLTGDAKRLVTEKMVNYINEGKSDDDTFRYQLCVNYIKSSGTDIRGYYNTPIKDNDEYSVYVYAYEHPAGEVCYKIDAVLNKY